MTQALITFVSHTNKPGGGELSLRRYLDATSLRVRLATSAPGGVWDGVGCEVLRTDTPAALRSAVRESHLVVANSMRAAFLLALVAPRGVRLAYWVRDGLVDSAMSPTALRLTRWVTARRMTAYIANSSWTADTVVRALQVPRDTIDVVPSMCGISRGDLDRDPRQSPGEPLRLLYLGRISPWKAPHVAVEALERILQDLPDAQLTIAGGVHFGEEGYGDRLRTLADSSSRTTWVGHVDSIQQLLDSHDVLVHCSVVPEPFGQVLVQGLGAGMAVVGTDAGGPRETLQGAPVPLLYPAGDACALAHRVREACGRYAEVSAWALARARDFTDEQLSERTDGVLAGLAHPAG